MTNKDFSDKYLSLSESLYRIAYYILESESDAEDVIQDFYLKLWDKKDSLSDVQNPKAYCMTLVKNLCLDRIRKHSRAHKEDLTEDICSEEDTLSAMSDRQTLKRVMKAMDELPENQRKILTMKVFEGLSYEEITLKTGINNLTLRVMLSQARNKLKKVL